MKKLFVIILMVFLSANLFAEVHGDYIKTENGTFFFKRVRQGVKCCLVGVTESGEKMKFTKPDILSFCKDGQVFEKMPLYKNDKLTDKQEFMALVCYRHGMKLYKYENMSGSSDQHFRHYYIFNGNNYVLEVTEKNKPTLVSFFNSK